jgi:hypothetical protein
MKVILLNLTSLDERPYNYAELRLGSFPNPGVSRKAGTNWASPEKNSYCVSCAAFTCASHHR